MSGENQVFTQVHQLEVKCKALEASLAKSEGRAAELLERVKVLEQPSVELRQRHAAIAALVARAEAVEKSLQALALSQSDVEEPTLVSGADPFDAVSDVASLFGGQPPDKPEPDSPPPAASSGTALLDFFGEPVPGEATD